MRAPRFPMWPILRVFALLVLGSPCLEAITITRTSSPVIYIDTGITPALVGSYVSYAIKNDSAAPLNDVWVDLTSFSGGVVSLAPNESGIVHLGSLAAGETKTAYFYLRATGATATAQSHVVSVYTVRPPGAAIANASFSVTVEETIKANPNKVNTVITTPNSPTLGALVVMTVTGETGTIGGSQLLSFTPAAYLDWPANSFELVSTSITFSGANTGTFTDRLFFGAAQVPNSANTNYTAVYTFRAVGTLAAPTVISPVGYINSGQPIKHTDTGGFGSLQPIPPVANALTLSKQVSTSVALPGSTVTFTVRVSNSSTTNTSILEDIVDTLPAGAFYLPGTSTFGGTPIPDPAVSGSMLTWTGMFSVPPSESRDLTFQAVLPNAAGSYTNSAVGHTGTEQIDTTLSTADNAPATPQ